MNEYESMRRILQYASDYLDIVPDTAANNADVTQVRQMLDAYDALAPTPEMWAQYPGARWYAIDTPFWRNGASTTCFYQDEPLLVGDEWNCETGDSWAGEDVVLPIGIDFRLCKWSRPEAK